MVAAKRRTASPTEMGKFPKSRPNEHCPCGSGRKYKKCCGVGRVASRKCGPCTGCCDGWLRINVYGHLAYPGQPCPFSTGHSCSIYHSRPQAPCREFMCGWMEQGSPLPEWFRPDRSGVIVLLSKLDWRGMDVDVVVPADSDPGERVLNWMRNYGMQHQRPFMYQAEGIWFGFGPPEFQQEVRDKVRRGEALW